MKKRISRESRTCPAFSLLIAILGWMAGTPVMMAQFSASPSSPFISGFDGFIIQSDATNPPAAGVDRSTLKPNVEVSYSWTAGTAKQEMRILTSLYDSKGNVIGLDLGGGVTGNEVEILDAINPANFVSPHARTYNPVLRPNAVTTITETYYLRVRTEFRDVGAPSWTTGGTKDGANTQMITIPARPPVDDPWNIIAQTTSQFVWADRRLATSPGADFTIQPQIRLIRYDDYLSTVKSHTTNVSFNVWLQDAVTAAMVPMEVLSAPTSVNIDRHTGGSVPAPAQFFVNPVITFRPAAGALLDPTHTFYPVFEPTFTEANGSIQTGVAMSGPARNFYNANGNLYFGSTLAQYYFTYSDPYIAGTISGGKLHVSLDATAYLPEVPSGWINGPFAARLESNGDMIYEGGGIIPVINPGGPSTASINGATLTRTGLSVGPSGAIAGSVTLKFPPGFGFTLASDSLDLRCEHSEAGTLLGAGLVPAQITIPAASYGVAQLYVYHERMPLLQETSSISFSGADGKFSWAAGTPVTYPDTQVLNDLATIRHTLAPSAQTDLRRGNDQMMAKALISNTAGGFNTFVFDATTATPKAKNSVTVGNGSFLPHFPSETLVNFDAGVCRMTDGLIVSSTSFLGTASGSVKQSESCPNSCDTGEVVATHDFVSDGLLSFANDGGVTCKVNFPSPLTVKWGRQGSSTPTHTVKTIAAGSFYMPGWFLPGAETVHTDFPVPHLLLSGRGAPTNAALYEKYGTPAYANGVADYPGLNVRHFAGFEGTSKLGGTSTGVYMMASTSKFVLRPSGVQGIHEAVPASFPAALSIYGFQVNFSRFGVSFLNQLPEESVIDGAVVVPTPANFTQDFARLQINCVGQLGMGSVPSGQPAKTLQYWHTDFQTHRMQFAQPNDGSCPTPNTNTGYLVIDAQLGQIPLLGANRQARLSFKPDGNLIRPVDTDAGGIAQGMRIDISRINLPGKIDLRPPLADPSSAAFKLDPIRSAYFNHYAEADRPANGFINVVGKLDVPFFNDAKLHLHVETNNAAATRIMGGWPRDGRTSPSHGWEVAGQHFFNTDDFDRQHRGYPAGVAVTAYRDPGDLDNYRPRVQRFWLDLVDFDFPVEWNTLENSLRSPERFAASTTPRAPSGQQDALPWTNPQLQVAIFAVKTKLPQLTPSVAEITFKAEANRALPRINIQALTADLLRQLPGGAGLPNGPLASLVGALGPEVQNVLNGQILLDRLVNTLMTELIDRGLQVTADPVIDEVYARLVQGYGLALQTENILCGAPPSLDPPQGVLEALDLQISAMVTEVLNGIGAVEGVAQQVDNAFGTVLQGIAALQAMANPTGDMATLREAIERLVSDLAPSAVAAVIGPLIADTAGSLLHTLATRNASAFREIHRLLGRLADMVSNLRSSFNTIVGPLRQALTQITSALGEFNAFKTRLRTQLCGFIREILGEAGRFLADNTPAQVKARVRQFIRDQITSSFIYRELQDILRNALAPVRQLYESTIGAVFQRIESFVTEIINTAFGAAQQFVEPINNALGAVDEALQATKFHGYARINGDTLQEARVDANMKWKLGRASDNLELHGYFVVRNHESESPRAPDLCSGPGGKRTEVIIGADRIPIRFANQQIHITAEGRCIFGEGAIFPSSIGGRVQMDGSLTFGEVSITDPRVAFMFGATTGVPAVPLCHVAGRARGRYRSWELEAGLFLGSTCGTEPLEVMDDRLEFRVLDPLRRIIPGFGTGPEPYLLGVYLRGRVWIPVNEILGIPSSCLLDLRANAGVGGFAFLADSPDIPQVGIDSLLAGGSFLLGVEGRVLCIASVEGELEGAAAGRIRFDSPLTPAVAGVVRGRVKGCIGFDPFKLCIEKELSYGMSLDLGSTPPSEAGVSNPPSTRMNP